MPHPTQTREEPPSTNTLESQSGVLVVLSRVLDECKIANALVELCTGSHFHVVLGSREDCGC